MYSKNTEVRKKEKREDGMNERTEKGREREVEERRREEKEKLGRK